MTLEAIANYGQELQKARRRIEEANRAGEAILTRLQNDLEAVRSFAEEESGSYKRFCRNRCIGQENNNDIGFDSL